MRKPALSEFVFLRPREGPCTRPLQWTGVVAGWGVRAGSRGSRHQRAWTGHEAPALRRTWLEAEASRRSCQRAQRKLVFSCACAWLAPCDSTRSTRSRGGSSHDVRNDAAAGGHVDRAQGADAPAAAPRPSRRGGACRGPRDRGVANRCTLRAPASRARLSAVL